MDKKPVLASTVIAGVFKAMSAFAAFFVTLAITRLLETHESGIFLLALSLLTVSSVFFRLGLDNVLLRIIGSGASKQFSSQVMITGVSWVLLLSVLFTVIVYYFSIEISLWIGKPDFSPVISVIIFALPPMAVFFLLSFGFQAYHRVVLTLLFRGLGTSIVFLVILFALWSFGFRGFTAFLLSIVYLISIFIVLFFSAVTWYHQTDRILEKPKFNDSEIWSASSNLWAATTMSLAVQWSGILIAGALVATESIAHLSAAQRTAMLISFVLMVVNMVVAPRYARLWNEGDLVEIRRLAKWSTRGMLVLASPIVLVMFIFPEPIMGLFGQGYEEGALLLLIMAIGQFINVATGSVGYLLNMSGHERDFRRVTMFAGPLTIVLSYCLVAGYGVVGAAIATAVGLSLQNLGALYMVKKRLGFWPMG